MGCDSVSITSQGVQVDLKSLCDHNDVEDLIGSGMLLNEYFVDVLFRVEVAPFLAAVEGRESEKFTRFRQQKQGFSEAVSVLGVVADFCDFL